MVSLRRRWRERQEAIHDRDICAAFSSGERTIAATGPGRPVARGRSKMAVAVPTWSDGHAAHRRRDSVRLRWGGAHSGVTAAQRDQTEYRQLVALASDGKAGGEISRSS